jgi:S1-C subfamily serine protease
MQPRARRPSLDIVTLPIGPDEAEQIGLPANYGILIERVLPDGAAERAGLHGGSQLAYKGNTQVMLGGDLIVGCDGQDIQSPQDLSNALNAHHAGDTITLTVFRGQQKMKIKVTLSDAKEVTGARST